MRDATAAVLTKLGKDSSHVIGHKDWAGASQGKWDPGNLDVVGWFRGEVAKAQRGEFKPKPETKPPAPQPSPAPALFADRAERHWVEWNALVFGNPDAVELLARAAKAGDTRAALALTRLEQTNPAVLQQFLKGA